MTVAVARALSSQLRFPMRLVVVPTRPAPCTQVSSETCDMIVLKCKTLSRFSNSSDNNRILLTRLLYLTEPCHGFIPAQGEDHNQQFIVAQQQLRCGATIDMAPSQAPFLYSAVHSDSRFPEPKFDPKAVTRASWTPPSPRKKHDGPLVSFNTHPE